MSIAALTLLICFILTTLSHTTNAQSSMATTTTSPVLISTSSKTPTSLTSTVADSPISLSTDSNDDLIAMFNATTIFLQDVTWASWEFSLPNPQPELTASTFCLEIWDHKGNKVSYNATNTCHNMIDNHLETAIPFSTAVKKDAKYLFSITVVLKTIGSKWTTDLCGVLKQTWSDLSSTSTNVPFLGSKTKGSPGLLLSVPEWRNNQFGVCTFSFLFLASQRVQLKHIFFNGMLSALEPTKATKDRPEHTCYVNQAAYQVKLVYDAPLNIPHLPSPGLIPADLSLRENEPNDQKFYYPLLEFIQPVPVFANLQTFVSCPSLEVIGKYLDPNLAGLAALGSIHLVSIDPAASSSTHLSQSKQSLQVLSRQLDPPQSQASVPESPPSALPLANPTPPQLHLPNQSLSPNDECTDALAVPVFGMADKNSFFTTAPLLTFGSSKNTTHPLLSVKNSNVSTLDGVSHASILLDLRGFDLSPAELSPPLSLQPHFFSPTALLTYFTSPISTLFNRISHQSLSKLHAITSSSSISLPSTFLSLLAPPRSQHTFTKPNLTADPIPGPTLSCFATGYRLDRVNIEVIAIDLQGNRETVHMGTYLSANLSNLLLSTLNVTYSTPQIRYQLELLAIRTLDTSTDLSTRVQLSCSINSGFGDKSATVISHAKIYPPIAHSVFLNTAIVAPEKLAISTQLDVEPELPYATMIFSLVNLAEPITNGLRMRWNGNHDFIGDLKQCVAVGYDDSNTPITPHPLPIKVWRETDIVDLRPPFEYDYTVPIPDYLPPYDKDTAVDVKFSHIYFDVKLDLIEHLYSYNITCADGYIAVPNDATLDPQQQADKFFTTSLLHIEQVKPTTTTPKSVLSTTLSEGYDIVRTQAIAVNMVQPPNPLPPPPEPEKREDNLLFFSIFVLVLVVTLLGCTFWLLRLKKIRDQQRKAIIEQQKRQHEQMINPSYTDDYAYQLVT